ncbi:MAG TPA: Crp/Fnr family transcriptional regulator [Magnetospirillum sp.]|nr:Crp/Fnr family transcriptional regulator [Magnetospirillum sp.]
MTAARPAGYGLSARGQADDAEGLLAFLRQAQAGGAPMECLPAAKNSWLFQLGDAVSHILVVESGAVVFRRPDICGELVAIDLAGRGGIMGFRAFIGGGTHAIAAQCSLESMVWRIPVSTVESSRPLERLLIARLARELTDRRERMLQVTTLSVRDRLLILLAQLSRDFCTLCDGPTMVVAPPLSRIDMAALAGMTPESLCRCIRGLEAENLVHFSRRHVVIPSVTAMRRALEQMGVSRGVDEGSEQRLVG